MVFNLQIHVYDYEYLKPIKTINLPDVDEYPTAIYLLESLNIIIISTIRMRTFVIKFEEKQ